jgi:serine/threonine protein kinase/tetratricopeptide (TPR) repeat protein
MMTQRLIANRYETGALLGQGGMGAVFLGRDSATDRPVAIKELRHDVSALDPLIMDRFRREAETLRRLDHPNIVKILDAVEEHDRQFLVMEYVPGGSLDALLRRARLSVRRVLEIGLDLADALSRVHRLGIVHRDIKPGNVLLAADGTPRLTDFGAAFEGSGTRLTETGVVIGTFAYLSPEVCEGKQPDASADLWAFGVMLFEMLAGRRPFEGPTTAALLAAIVRKPAPDVREFRPDIPPALAQLVAGMLEKDRTRRITSARLVGATLETILGAESAGSDAARFAADPDTVEAPSLLAELLSSTPPLPTRPPLPTPTAATAVAETVTAPTSLTPARPSIRTSWLLAGALLVVLLLGGLVFALRERSAPPQTAAVSQAQEPVRVAPVSAGEYMVLVAQLERIAAPERDQARFIADGLRQSLEGDAPFSRIRVRSYPGVITSDAEARTAAETNGATLIVWGNDQGDYQEVNLQVGAVSAFPNLAIERSFVEQAANVRLRLSDPRTQSVAPYVLGALSMLQNAEGDVYETVRTIAIMGLVSGEPAEPLGSSVATFYHRATAHSSADPAGAVADLDRAIELAGGNPILYTSRGLAYQRQGKLDEARRDVETARRLGPESWAVPHAMLAAEAAQRGDAAAALAETDALVALRPDDWFPLTYRGALRALGGDRAGARADLERALELGPPTAEPYALAALVALHEGRMSTAADYAQTIVRTFPDPALGRRILQSALGSGAPGDVLGPLLASFTSLAIGQYDAALADADAALAARPDLPDALLLRGLAACNLGKPEEAAQAYSAALTASPADPLLLLLRGDARQRLGDQPGSEADLVAAAQNPAFAPHADAVRAGTLGCETLLGATK